MTTPYLKVGTRGSSLALAQTGWVCDRLADGAGIARNDIEIVIVKTTGDSLIDRSLSELGGKGLFTKELDDALIAGAIDCAVHSAKDLPTLLPNKIVIAGCPPREDPRDALIASSATSFSALPFGARLGSASLRRQAMSLRVRPDLRVGLLRGNVGTRLRKVASGEFDLTLLAIAGLKRLGLEAHATAILDIDKFLPAVGQGAIALTARQGDERVDNAVARIVHKPTMLALNAERAFLAELDGSCRTPIGGYAHIINERMTFRGALLSPDGVNCVEIVQDSCAADARLLGADVGREIRERTATVLPSP
jgi:hydroxymethylbilane synthase